MTRLRSVVVIRLSGVVYWVMRLSDKGRPLYYLPIGL